MSKLNRIVILGAGAAGLTTAESLRRLGFEGKILMVHAESTPPYDRPPLSKQVLAGSGLTLQNGIVCDAFCEAAPDIDEDRFVAAYYGL